MMQRQTISRAAIAILAALASFADSAGLGPGDYGRIAYPVEDGCEN